jgi:PiT family inorganic phosphate transporter
MLELVVFIIIVALIFDFLNGVNDAANSISTVVATQVLPPKAAVALAAFWNFAAAFTFGVAVALTIGTGIVDPNVVTPYLILAALLGAIIWTTGATYFGIPISVSHALIGGLVGSALAAQGPKAVFVFGILKKIVLPMIFSPLAGLIGALFLIIFVTYLVRYKTPNSVNRYFKKLQLVSASMYSFSHGTNDAQKTMGIITILLFSAGYLGSDPSKITVPLWVIFASYGAIALGTLVGGWRVIHTMGHKITRLRPVDGFCAETSGAAVILACSMLGIPVSTTHTISGSIMGVGSAKRLTAVRWQIARRIVWAWILTIPASAAVAAAIYLSLDILII